MSEITQEQLRTLWHTLGINPAQPRRKFYRNYYASPAGCKHMGRLVGMGLMKPGATCGRNVFHHATNEGIAVAYAAPAFEKEVA